MNKITIDWHKYIEVQAYLLAHLDILTFKLVAPDVVDIYFQAEEDITVFKLKYSL